VARIAGVDLPRDKRVDIALRYIYGIGSTRATSARSVASRSMASVSSPCGMSPVMTALRGS